MANLAKARKDKGKTDAINTVNNYTSVKNYLPVSMAEDPQFWETKPVSPQIKEDQKKKRETAQLADRQGEARKKQEDAAEIARLRETLNPHNSANNQSNSKL